MSPVSSAGRSDGCRGDRALEEWADVIPELLLRDLVSIIDRGSDSSGPSFQDRPPRSLPRISPPQAPASRDRAQVAGRVNVESADTSRRGRRGRESLRGASGVSDQSVIWGSRALFECGELGGLRSLGSGACDLRERPSRRACSVPRDGSCRWLAASSPGGGVVRGGTHVRPDVGPPRPRSATSSTTPVRDALPDRQLRRRRWEFFVADRAARRGRSDPHRGRERREARP